MDKSKRLIEIGLELGDAESELVVLSNTVRHTEQEIEERKAELVPFDGWPGSNADNRKASAEKTYREDPALQALRSFLSDSEDKIAQYRSLASRLEAERRGLEWSVTDELSKALERRTHGNPGADAARKLADMQAKLDALDSLVQESVGGPTELDELEYASYETPMTEDDLLEEETAWEEEWAREEAAQPPYDEPKEPCDDESDIPF